MAHIHGYQYIHVATSNIYLAILAIGMRICNLAYQSLVKILLKVLASLASTILPIYLITGKTANKYWYIIGSIFRTHRHCFAVRVTTFLAISVHLISPVSGYSAHNFSSISASSDVHLDFFMVVDLSYMRWHSRPELYTVFANRATMT